MSSQIEGHGTGMHGLAPRFSISELLKALPDMGEALSLACVNLHLEPTLARADELRGRLQAAQDAIGRMRRLMAESE